MSLTHGGNFGFGGREKRAAAISASASLLTTSVSENARERPLSAPAASTSARASTGIVNATGTPVGQAGKKRRKTTAAVPGTARSATGKNGRGGARINDAVLDVPPTVAEVEDGGAEGE